MKISGKNAIVTGGAHRVGKTICQMLAGEGANVAFTYHSAVEEAEITRSELTDLGVEALAVQCDISDWDAVKAMAAEVESHLGGVDIIVNNAGLFRRTQIPTDDVSLWQQVTRVSIDGTFYVCNALIPGMLNRGGGVIVNILDNAARQAWPGYTAHAVAKGGMLTLTRQLALELSPDIRTNAVLAGPVLPAEGMGQEAIESAAAKTLLKRWGSPSDVTSAVRYVIQSDYMIGEILSVDGGEWYG